MATTSSKRSYIFYIVVFGVIAAMLFAYLVASRIQEQFQDRNQKSSSAVPSFDGTSMPFQVASDGSITTAGRLTAADKLCIKDRCLEQSEIRRIKDIVATITVPSSGSATASAPTTQVATSAPAAKAK